MRGKKVKELRKKFNEIHGFNDIDIGNQAYKYYWKKFKQKYKKGLKI